jgi:ketosteroid isomerase-like protein
VTISVEDRFEIQDLLLRYAYLQDSKREQYTEELPKLVTQDVIFDSPKGSGYYEGRETIREWTKRPFHGWTRHFFTNFLVEEGENKDHVYFYTNFLMAKNSKEDGSLVLRQGCYTCEARRVDGKWLLARRTASFDDENTPPWAL